MEDVRARLAELGLTETVSNTIIIELGVSDITDLNSIKEEDLLKCGMKVIAARNLIKKIQGISATTAQPAVGPTVSFDSLLPIVPDDGAWLNALRAGGVLKVDQSTVISAVRAALAHRVGLYSIPETLAGKMEAFADSNEEQVDPEFYKIRRDLTRRSYAEIFSAIDGLDGTYVTEARKKQLFSRIDTHLWPAIISFFNSLKNWQEAWLQGASNPALMMSAIMAASTGMGTPGLPPGMMQPPDTGVLKDGASSVNDAINRVFSGVGVQIVAALAYDANRIKDTLSNPRLPALVGAANRDQMLKMLDVSVSANYPRLENNLTRFVLGIIQAQDQPAGNEELQYFGALYMLGTQVAWDQVTNNISNLGIGRKVPGNNRVNV